MTTIRFLIKCIDDESGEIREQVLDAYDEQAVREQLHRAGSTLLSVRRIKVRTQENARASGQLRRQFPIFCRDVRTLIMAGMTVVEAVDTLSAKERVAGDEQGIPVRLLSRLHQGQSLSGALENLNGTPPVLVAAVRAGERTSNLVEALDDYLRFDTLMTHLRRKVVSASIYPALVTTLGLGISVFLMIVVMPNFARMYENLRGSSSGLTAWMIAVSQFISAHQVDVLAAGILLIAVVGSWITSGAAFRQLLGAGYSIPFIRRRIEDFQLAMMYQALALLLKGGYPMTDAMTVTARSALSELLLASLQQARLRIEQGESVAQSLADTHLCDEVGRRLMAAAERNGDFHVAADVVSRLHGERFELFVERATRIVEPLLLMGVAIMVGSIVVMMYLPVFDMATRLR